MSVWFGDELNGSVGDRFERVATEVASLEAVVGRHGRLTFDDLYQRAGAVADDLRALAPDATTRAAVLCTADTSRIIGMMGVLLAGQTLVVLDPGAAPDWNARILADCEATLLVVDEPAAPHLARWREPAGSRRVVSIERSARDRRSTPGPRPQRRGRDLAAIVYTSGSTGRPKGVMRPHDSFLHTARLHGEVGGIGAGHRFGSVGSAGYARATGDAFAALLNGACLCLWDAQHHGIPAFGDWLASERVTSLNLPIALGRAWVALRPTPVPVPCLHDIRFSGALVHRRDVEQLAATLPGRWRAWAAYSSTEAGSITRAHPALPHELPDGPLPLGSAVDGRRVDIQREDGAPAPPGDVGEVVVRGRFMATGYWHNPELTHRLFRERPDGEAEYRTGDVGWVDAQGTLRLSGRRDDVVKVRGFSVATADVESALLDWPRVAQAAVLAVDDETGGRALAAFVVPALGDDLIEVDVRRHIAAVRPAFMVPRTVVLVDHLPMLDNGKPDRDALLRLVGASRDWVPGSGETSLERVRLAWSDVLRRQIEEVDATFLDLGGDSLAAAALESRLAAIAGRRTELGGLLAHQSIREQAAWLDRVLAGHAGAASGASGARIRALAERPGRPVIYMLPSVHGSLGYAPHFARAAEGLSVYGVEPPLRADGGFEAGQVGDLAAALAGVIAAHAGTGPISLMGPCGGGKLGIAVAERLGMAGVPCARVLMVDAPVPGAGSRSPMATVLGIAGWLVDAVRCLAREAIAGGPVRPARLIAATGWTLARRLTHPLAGRGTAQERRRKEQFRAMSRSYVPHSGADVPVVLIRGAWSQIGLRFAGSGRSLGWDHYCAALTVRFVPGTHASMYEPPFVESLARLAGELCATPGGVDQAA